MASEQLDPRSLPPGFSAAPPGEGGGGGGGGGGESKQAERDEQRQMMLTVMLTPAARERLNRVALVVSPAGWPQLFRVCTPPVLSQRPDNARLLEGHLMKMLQTRGAPAEKVPSPCMTCALACRSLRLLRVVQVDEAALTSMLEQITDVLDKRSGAAKKVVIQRKKRAGESDDDDDDDF